MHLRLLLLPALLLACGAPAHADPDGYGGFSVPSVDTMAAIARETSNQIVMKQIVEKQINGQAAPRRAPAAPGRAGAFPPPAFAAPAGGAVVETRFRRSAEVQRRAQQDILTAIGKHQPDAVPQYRKLFAEADMPRAFEEVTRGYGLSADDAADTVTSYWVMAWVVANHAALPAPASVRAARLQVAQGFANTDVGGYDPARRQMLSDEAIFNFLVLNQAWRNATQGRGGSLDELGEATQRNFLPLGADLRGLDLGPNGFARR